MSMAGSQQEPGEPGSGTSDARMLPAAGATGLRMPDGLEVIRSNPLTTGYDQDGADEKGNEDMNEIRIRSGGQEKVIPVSRVPELREKVTQRGEPWKGRGKPWVVFAVTFLRAALTYRAAVRMACSRLATSSVTTVTTAPVQGTPPGTGI